MQPDANQNHSALFINFSAFNYETGVEITKAFFLMFSSLTSFCLFIYCSFLLRHQENNTRVTKFDTNLATGITTNLVYGVRFSIPSEPLPAQRANLKFVKIPFRNLYFSKIKGKPTKQMRFRLVHKPQYNIICHHTIWCRRLCVSLYANPKYLRFPKQEEILLQFQ